MPPVPGRQLSGKKGGAAPPPPPPASPAGKSLAVPCAGLPAGRPTWLCEWDAAPHCVYAPPSPPISPRPRQIRPALVRSFVTGLGEHDARKASLGLAHSYSRAKVKFNVNKADNMIIQVNTQKSIQLMSLELPPSMFGCTAHD